MNIKTVWQICRLGLNVFVLLKSEAYLKINHWLRSANIKWRNVVTIKLGFRQKVPGLGDSHLNDHALS